MLDLATLLNRKLLMISGKGGTGKTVVATALALKAAALGKRVLVVESAVTEQITPLFGKPAVGHQEKPVAPGISCINLNPRLCFKEYVVEQLGMVQLYKRVFDHLVVKSFLDAIPGLGETMLLGRIFFTCELQEPARYDLVIFDAPALGHFYNLLTTPDAIIGSGMVGPLIKEVKRVKEFLGDTRKCAAVLVTLPEELVSSETLEFLPRLQQSTPLAIAGVIINRYLVGHDAAVLAAEQFGTLGDLPAGELGAVQAYLTRQYDKRRDAQQQLVAGLERLGMGDQYSYIPEQGVVAEPLSRALVEHLLAAMAA